MSALPFLLTHLGPLSRSPGQPWVIQCLLWEVCLVHVPAWACVGLTHPLNWGPLPWGPLGRRPCLPRDHPAPSRDTWSACTLNFNETILF